MPLIIKNDANEIVHTEGIEETGAPDTTGIVAERFEEKNYPFWKSREKGVYFSGTYIANYSIEVYENIHLTTYDMPAMPGLFFMKNGHIIANMYNNVNSLHFTSKQHNILFNPYATRSTTFVKQDRLEFLIISLLSSRFLEIADGSGATLEQMANNLAAGRNFMLNLNHNLPITYQMLNVMAEISNCTLTGGLQKLYLESKTLELLALQCAQIEQQFLRIKTQRINVAEIKKLKLAKEILLSDVQSPPSLTMLARLSGLNEFKLKKGFKEMFGTSVFNCFNDYRLEVACIQIKNNQQSITDVANDLGYSSLQHFSLAFKKKFGISPLQYRSLN